MPALQADRNSRPLKPNDPRLACCWITPTRVTASEQSPCVIVNP
jgi:hypothetical protein